MLNLRKLSALLILSVFSILSFSCSNVLNSMFKTGMNPANLNDSTFYVNNTKPVSNNLDGWKVLYLKSGELLSFSNYIEQGEYYIYIADANNASFNSSILSSQFKKTITEAVFVSYDEGEVAFDSQKNEYKSFEVKEPGTYTIKIQNKSGDGYCAFYIYSDDGKAFFTDPEKESGVITTITNFIGTYNYKKNCAYLSWASSNKDGIYYIYRNKQYIGKTNALSFSDRGVMADNSYTYEIKNGTSKSAITMATYKINTGKSMVNFSDSVVEAILYEGYTRNFWVTLEKGKQYVIRWADSTSKDDEAVSVLKQGGYILGDFILYVYDSEGNKILAVDDNQTIFSVESSGDYSVTIDSKDKKTNSYCGYLIYYNE